jgi:hypothetical protein
VLQRSFYVFLVFTSILWKSGFLPVLNSNPLAQIQEEKEGNGWIVLETE